MVQETFGEKKTHLKKHISSVLGQIFSQCARSKRTLQTHAPNARSKRKATMMENNREMGGPKLPRAREAGRQGLCLPMPRCAGVPTIPVPFWSHLTVYTRRTALETERAGVLAITLPLGQGTGVALRERCNTNEGGGGTHDTQISIGGRGDAGSPAQLACSANA